MLIIHELTVTQLKNGEDFKKKNSPHMTPDKRMNVTLTETAPNLFICEEADGVIGTIHKTANRYHAFLATEARDKCYLGYYAHERLAMLAVEIAYYGG